MGKSIFKIPTGDTPEAAIEAIKGFDLASLTDADALRTAEETITAEVDRIAALDDPSDADLDLLEALVEMAESVRAEGAEREGAVQARRDRAKAAKERLAAPAAEDEGGEGDEDGDGTDDGDESGTDDGGEGEGDESGDGEGEGTGENEGGQSTEVEAQEQAAAVAAAAAKNKRRAPSLLKGRTRPAPVQRPAAREEAASSSSVTITASAGIRGIEAGSELSDFDAMVDAFATRAASHPGHFVPDQYMRHPVASFSRGVEAFDGLMDTDEQYRENPLALFDAAADEKRLTSGKGTGSLAAAGGWCAPSETWYDFVSLETTDGLYDMPEVGIKRGGVNLTTGPDFSAIYQGSGFVQTEAQAIAGDTKNCYEVDCPEFEETRLDAIGLCIKSPLLTNTAYPELLRRVLSGALVAHEAKKAIRAVNAVASELGAAQTVADGGSTARSILTSLELAAEGERNKYHMSRSMTMEVVLPNWVRVALRDDLQSRLRQADPVTDAQLDAHFAARKLRVQFIYGFGDTNVVAGPGGINLILAFPATFPALIYPAGTFVKGVADVINLDTVYDSTDLEVNVFTAAFIEEAMLVVRRAPGGGRLTIPTNQSGAVGPATLPAWAEQA